MGEIPSRARSILPVTHTSRSQSLSLSPNVYVQSMSSIQAVGHCPYTHYIVTLRGATRYEGKKDFKSRRPVLWPCDRAPPRARALLPAQPDANPQSSGPLGALLSSPALGVRLLTALQSAPSAPLARWRVYGVWTVS